MGTQAMILLALSGVGGLLSIVSTIWLLVLGFRRHVLWGVAIFFLPGAGLVYAVMHWAQAQEAMLLGVVGALMMIAAVGLGVMVPSDAMNISSF